MKLEFSEMLERMPLLVVLFHGVGSNGADMAPLGDAWKVNLPNLECIAPDGIMPGPQGFGRAWFSINGVTDQNRPDRIEESRLAFDEMLSHIIDKAGFGQRLDRVVLVGFSQGSMMALDAVVSGRWPVAGVLAYSGRLATRSSFQICPTRIRLIHGDADPVISVNETRTAYDILHESGFSVEATILPYLPHTISAEGVELGRKFLADL
jgi:phospholipase/carboxylesterase